MQEFVENGGVVPGEDAMTDAQKEKVRARNDKNNKRVPFGNLYKPIYDRYGELVGFDIRQDLMCMMYHSHGFQPKVLERTIKTCMFINKLLRQGQSIDYSLRQVHDTDKEVEADKLQEIGIQVNE